MATDNKDEYTRDPNTGALEEEVKKIWWIWRRSDRVNSNKNSSVLVLVARVRQKFERLLCIQTVKSYHQTKDEGLFCC